jgi:hypothetical protein
MEREKGQDVASMSCSNCGEETPLVAMPDGGMAQGVCPNCYGPAEVRATAAADRPAKMKREKTTTVESSQEEK